MVLNYEMNKEILLTEIEYQKYLTGQDSEKLDLIDKKKIHTFEVVKDGSEVANILGFNDSLKEFSKIAFLYHDIGRFYQARLIGNYDDTELYNYMKQKEVYSIRNHGNLGSNILLNIFTGYYRKLFGSSYYEAEKCYKAIMQIVNNHVDMQVPEEHLLILTNPVINDNDISDLLIKSDFPTRRAIINAITQIVQDVDRLDIYHQILDGRWVPTKSSDKVADEVLDMYYKGEYFDIRSLKEKGLWNANVGELLRLNFINQIKLVSVAKVILDEDIIMRLKKVRNNPIVDDAFDYASEKLKVLIKNSSNGITINKN